MRQLKRNVLSMALASATLLLAANVQAQDSQPASAQQADADGDGVPDDKDPDAIDTITVTGIAASMQRAIDTKKESNAIVEAISAEDIGKLPDVSIADSISRLPGLTTQRFGGRAQEINIRGFSGDFSTSTLNGREQVSPGDNRNVEFDQYPSELTSSVVVYKSQEPSLVGQGLSGTVDLRTVRPLDYTERVFALNVRGDMNRIEGKRDYGYRASFSYIDQFKDNTIGLALGYARLDNPLQSNQFNSGWGYDPDGMPGGLETFSYEGDNVRDGAMATLEFRPNDVWTSTFDVFYSKFDKDERKRGLQYGTGGATATNVVRDGSGTVTDATLALTGRVVVRNDVNYIHDTLLSAGWRNEFVLGDAWRLTADLSHSEADREQRSLELYAATPPGVFDTVRIHLNQDGYYDQDFGFDYTDPSLLRLMDAGGWGQDGYDKTFSVEDSLDALRLDLEYTFNDGPLSSIKFGANVTDRDKSRSTPDEAFLCISQTACGDGSSLPLPASDGNDFPFAGIGGVYGFDPLRVVGQYRRRLNVNSPGVNAKNWEVSERLTTAYLQANIDTTFLGAPLKGSLGVQAIRAEQDSNGVPTFNGLTVGERAANGVSYTTYLPSLNLRLSLPDELYIRFAAGRQMARPRMDNMAANAEFSYDVAQDRWNGGGGNPLLKPWLADAIDFSVEKYFADTGYFTVGLFNKELKSYIYNNTVLFDFSQLPIPAGSVPPQALDNQIGTFSQPVNGEGGSLHGFEAAVSIPFDMFWAPLEGLGFTANYTELTTNIEPNGPGTSQPLPGLSKYISNMSLFYERYGFSARVSQRSRSDFRGEIADNTGLRVLRDFKGETVTDFQLGYTIQSGPLKDLGFLLQVYNVENEPFQENALGYANRPVSYTEYGRTYLFGVNYRF